MRIIVQFVGQSVGIMLYHRKHKEEKFPFCMWLYPLPAIIGIIVWLFIFFSAEPIYIAEAFSVIATGCLVYWLKQKFSHR